MAPLASAEIKLKARELGFDACGIAPASDLPELRFRRDYLPAEQSRFQELGVTPPEYEITLR